MRHSHGSVRRGPEKKPGVADRSAKGIPASSVRLATLTACSQEVLRAQSRTEFANRVSRLPHATNAVGVGLRVVTRYLDPFADELPGLASRFPFGCPRRLCSMLVLHRLLFVLGELCLFVLGSS
jgi:hypothetical protein